MKTNHSYLIRACSKAIFSVAQEIQATQDCSLLLNLLALIIKHPAIKKFIAQHAITHEQKTTFLMELLNMIVEQQSAGNVKIKAILPKISNLIYLLIKKNKINLISYIYKKYDELALRITNQMRVSLTSATELNVHQKECWQHKINDYCLQHFNKQALINFMVDNSIIGGLLIKYNEITIDYSLKGRLLDLQQTLNSTYV